VCSNDLISCLSQNGEFVLCILLIIGCTGNSTNEQYWSLQLQVLCTHFTCYQLIIYVAFSALYIMWAYSVACTWLNYLNGSMKELNMFHNYETEKITRKPSDVAENLQLYWVVWFFRPRSLCMTTHLMLFSERLPIYTLCMTISGGRTEQHVIIGFGQLAAVD